MIQNIPQCIEEPLKNYVLHFNCNNGSGWGFINAKTINQAISVFKNQTRYQDIKVRDIKELKHWGEEIQLVFEGAVIKD